MATNAPPLPAAVAEKKVEKVTSPVDVVVLFVFEFIETS